MVYLNKLANPVWLFLYIIRPYLSPEEFAGSQNRRSNEFSNPAQLDSKLQVLYSVQRMRHLSQRYENL